MSDQRIDERLIPPVADRRYVRPPPSRHAEREVESRYDDRYGDRSGRSTVWTVLGLLAVIVIGGLIYFGHRADVTSSRSPTTTTGTAPQPQPRPVPQVPAPTAPPVRAR